MQASVASGRRLLGQLPVKRHDHVDYLTCHNSMPHCRDGFTLLSCQVASAMPGPHDKVDLANALLSTVVGTWH